ncbi:hypothetical protein LCGC14_2292270 [marine sediment metagenome]|uniref:HTH asnC-type domain-containing protein n=1 Tax=marine sediment metagenome TaxID=412755 RepID=A0A0F9DDK1_9ZZZZ
MSGESRKASQKVDNEILSLLSKDCRLSNRELGRKSGRSPLTIKNHIDDLEERGIIKGYRVNLDYEKLGYNIIALVEVTISKGKMLEVEKHIANQSNVFAVYDITGTYDALILARFKNREDLSDMVKDLHKSPYIERTNTHIVLNVILEQFIYQFNEKKKKE